MKRRYHHSQNQTDIIYIDETGFAPATHRTHGWSQKGTRVYGEIHYDKRPRTGLLAGYLNHRLIAPLVFDGTCNTDLFNQWLDQFLCPNIKPGSVIVMDNATFHKSRTTQQLIQEVKCQTLFLPPYSPHLNPIEQVWANIKRQWSYHSNLTLDSIIASYG